MKKMRTLLVIIMLGTLTLPGCGNFSPRGDLTEQIDNQGGKIDNLSSELQSLQNSINTQIGQLKVQAEKIENLQTGLANFSEKNTGVQILKGDGPLVVIFGIGVVFLLLAFYYRNKQQISEKTANLLAEQIVRLDNLDLEDEVFMAARSTGVEKEVLSVMLTNQRKYGLRR
jgi:predicted PurR-regulated permease PerM